MKLLSRSNIKKLIIVLFCAGVVGAGFFYYQKTVQSEVAQADILVYEPARDRAQLLTLFRKHWNWLVLDDNYPLEYVFDNLSPKPEDPRYKGALKVNVIRDKDKLIGFTAYYMKTQTLGQLLFLVVDEAVWGKRYGQRLLEYGVKQLQNMGAKTIHMYVYKGNVKAMKLYKRVGFKVIEETGPGFMMQYAP